MEVVPTAMAMNSTVIDADSVWDQQRWVKILNRIEHRQPVVGLRFSGPPLWLEVTMTGPDSDLWPTISEQLQAWDWQSNAPCVELACLVDEGADDDCLLAVAARYALVNLVLNAVHEIGEWFRFDGQRLFPAHGAAGVAVAGGDDQGNGAVTLRLAFGPGNHQFDAAPAASAPDHECAHRTVEHFAEVAGPSRFTYLPNTTISYEAAGPVIQRWSDGPLEASWPSSWSRSTLDARGTEGPEVVALIGRDVHRALVSHEANRICRAFYVDGSRPWRRAFVESDTQTNTPATDEHDADVVFISIDYAVNIDSLSRAGVTNRERMTSEEFLDYLTRSPRTKHMSTVFRAAVERRRLDRKTSTVDIRRQIGML